MASMDEFQCAISETIETANYFDLTFLFHLFENGTLYEFDPVYFSHC